MKATYQVLGLQVGELVVWKQGKVGQAVNEIQVGGFLPRMEWILIYESSYKQGSAEPRS